MSILNGIKKVVGKIRGAAETKALTKQESEELKKWKDKLETAKTHWNNTAIDERELLYNGTHDVDRNINDTQDPPNGRRKANNVHNIVYEFIEAQVDTTIPQPSVKSKRRGFEYLAKIAEESAKNDIEEIDIERINDENERITPIQGFSIFEVMWDPDFKHHLYRGEIKIDNRHPKSLIPQPGIYNIQKMDYFFMLSSVTKSYVKRRFNKTLNSADNEQYPEINYFSADQSTQTSESEKVTLITVYYRDDNGDIGKFVWSNETILEDLPKFYYRRLEKCVKCGAVKGSKEECQEPTVAEVEGMLIETPCGSTKYKESIEETETLSEPVTLTNGAVIPLGTEVPYFQPTRYPVIIRRNVPVNFQLGGQSDVDIIRDQADAIKKIVSRIEEKIIRSGHIIIALNDHRFNLTNDLYQVVRGSPAELQSLNIKNLTADIGVELEITRYMYKAAQDTLGITNSWQGKEDKTAQSGVAKQIQVQQASGRMQSKQFNKYAAFKELFEIMFEFKLAYYDELRPYMTRGPMGEIDYGEFNKYDFLQMDADGEWYYNTDFLFSASAGDGFPKERMWLSQQAAEDFRSGAIDKVGLWTIREGMNFPNAAEMKQAAIEEKQMKMQQQQIQTQMPQGPPMQGEIQIDNPRQPF